MIVFIGYGLFRKHTSLSKKVWGTAVFTLIQTCENVELTLSKNCDPLFSLLASLWVLWTPVYKILVRTLII